MTNQVATPFGLQVLDPRWLTAAGDAAPSLRAVAALDQNSFAVGDVVHETGAVSGGIAVVSSSLPQLKADGTGYQSFSPRQGAQPLIVVAVAPAAPGAPISPVLAAGVKGSVGFVWVISAGNREFFIAGDATTPARAERAGLGDPPLSLSAQSANDGTLFARLRFAAPSGGLSGTALDGSSFTDGSSSKPAVPGGYGDLRVLGLADGMPLAAHTLYRVQFRPFS
jgi:hypothetical protein